MGTPDAFRRVADAARRVAGSLGIDQRTTTVTLRTETWSAAIGTAGATPTNTDTVLSPTPKVTKLSAEQASYFGGGIVDQATGRLSADVYKIGPITQSYAGGGYSLLTLAPAESTTVRTVILLSGDDFASGGELFEIVHADASRPQSITLTVRRTGTLA